MAEARRTVRRLIVPLAALIVGISAACARSSANARVIGGGSSALPAEPSESELASRLVCHDTLGRPEYDTRRTNVSRCTPCLPFGLKDAPERAIAHARRLWQQGARAPYDSLDSGAICTSLAYGSARAHQPDNDSLAVEIALFQLADARDSVRTRALGEIDDLLGRLSDERRYAAASAVMSQLAMGLWDRAQRQLERPTALDADRLERLVHDIDARNLSYVPAVPTPSRGLGVSEAEWSARLFTAAVRLLVDEEVAAPAERARLVRLALAPWVVLGRWQALDSAARALTPLARGDSVLRTARALAAYRRMTDPVAQQSQVMAQFDSAMMRMPTADSLRYDSFDGVLTANDDEWRYGFLPDERARFDARGWSVLDPMWSTPVNEIRLERRARVAEADFRYADVARPGEAGSETRMGAVLLRRGVPDLRWVIGAPWFDGRRELRRRWGVWTAVSEVNDTPDLWRAFHGTHFTAQRMAMYEPEADAACAAVAAATPTIWSCALATRADWSGIPFHGATDAVDVSLVRFRAAADSADVYIGARIPLRRFTHRDEPGAMRDDRIRLGMWLTAPEGRTVVRSEESRPLPDVNAIAWNTQWRARVGSLSLMHRVEAMEPSQRRGARGVAQFTSDAMVAFPLRGFGMSDVLIADSARIGPAAGPRARWRDVEVTPNAAVVRPAQRFAMLWEVYDLTPGPDGRVRWRVRIRRERGEVQHRDDMQAVLRGERSAGTRVQAAEPDAPDMSFERSETASPAILENITFGLNNAGEGRHVIQVTIEDLVSGRIVSRGVGVRVLDPRTERRGASSVSVPR